MELQSRVNELRQRGLGLAAISYDRGEVLSAFAKKQGITFPLLSDAGFGDHKEVWDSESRSGMGDWSDLLIALGDLFLVSGSGQTSPTIAQRKQ